MVTKAKAGKLTKEKLDGLAVGEWAIDIAARGAGVLEARKLSTGEVCFYFRYTGPNGQRARIVIGTGLSLKDAQRQAADLTRKYQDGATDLRGVLDAEKREAERIRRDAERATEIAAARDRATLGALLNAYVAKLRQAGKESARQVERAFAMHVEAAWPKLWRTPVHAVTLDDLVAVVAHVAHAGKTRAAEKLRSYLRAAYSAAVTARQRPSALTALKELDITENTALNMATIERRATETGTRERVLSVDEFRAYWKRITALTDPDGALLRFHLLTGAQRVEQLSRLTIGDYNHDDQHVRLLDTKGRRRVARVHVVPLTADALKSMQAMRGIGHGKHLFTVSEGRAAASYAMAQARLRDVAEAMREAGEVSEAFSLGDLRRTVETRLAAEGVSMEVRAQLQSHGLSGVQAKHYDMHDYMDEKLAALNKLHRILTRQAHSKVTNIHRAPQQRRTND